MQITGKATIFIDGQRIAAENGAKANPGGIARQFERHGGRTYNREEEVPPSVECTVMHTAETDILALSAISNATVIFECDTGRKYVMRGASTENPAEVDTSTGKSALRLVGDAFDEM